MPTDVIKEAAVSESYDNMMAIFALRSVESARNQVRALKADKEGRGREARLFRALANAQQVHAAKALMLLRGVIGDTDGNLSSAEAAVESSSKALRSMIKVAVKERSAPEESSMTQFMKASYSHSATVKSTEQEEAYQVCQICGFISSDGVPERCPVCRAVPQQFQAVE